MVPTAVVAAVAKNPAWYTNPVTGAVMGGLTLGSILAKHYVGQGRKTANLMTGTGAPQDTLNHELARISTLAETDPTSAAEQLTKAWNDFDTSTKSWIAEGGNKAKVAKQALSTPALIDTVDRLAGQVGIPQLRSGSSNGSGGPTNGSVNGGTFTGTSGPTTDDLNLGGSDGMTLGKGLNFGTNLLKTVSGGIPKAGGTTQDGAPTDTDNPDNTGNYDIFTILKQSLPEIFGSINSANKDTTKKKSLLDQLLPYIMLGTNIGTNAYGTKSAIDANSAAAKINSDAFLKAAQMQSDASGNALAFQKQMYDQGRQDQAPWLASGQKALSLRDALTMNGRVQGMPNLMPSMGGR